MKPKCLNEIEYRVGFGNALRKLQTVINNPWSDARGEICILVHPGETPDGLDELGVIINDPTQPKGTVTFARYTTEQNLDAPDMEVRLDASVTERGITAEIREDGALLFSFLVRPQAPKTPCSVCGWNDCECGKNKARDESGGK